MSYFLNEDFLLQTETAKRLYHEYAKDMPIIDYHCHLPPKEIAENKNYRNLTHIWLAGDHYKWRAMRTWGVPEKYITGDATDEEKFLKWAETVPYTMRNPLYHWTHMELKKPFGVEELLSAQNGKKVYDHCTALLQQDDFRPRALLLRNKVTLIGTTDDPLDDLCYHQQLAKEDFHIKVVPSFRPDGILIFSGKKHFREYVNRLSAAADIDIKDLTSLLQALQKRVDYFHDNGCRASDHAFAQMPFPSATTATASFIAAVDKNFQSVLKENNGEEQLSNDFQYYVLQELCKMYHAKGWVQQFHLGAMRNNNSRMKEKLGPDTGFDSIGDSVSLHPISRFFDTLDSTNQLAKTILYNLNPADNAAFATIIGNFNDGSTKGKMQMGSAWWFLDQKDGMEEQMNILSNMGLISCFIGMLTDSRSFLSYSRHEYFRRILCNLFGTDIEHGLLPHDIPWIGKMIQDICYHNAKNYFPFNL